MKLLLLGCLSLHALCSAEITDWVSSMIGNKERQAIQAYHQHDYEKALIALHDSMDTNPYHAVSNYNVGTILYKQKKYQDAKHSFVRAAQEKTSPVQLQEQAYFNAGNSCYQLQQWKEAVEAYQFALQINKDNKSTQHNLQLALYKLQQQQMKDQVEQERQKDANQEHNEQIKTDENQDQMNHDDKNKSCDHGSEKSSSKNSSGGSNESSTAEQEDGNQKGSEKQHPNSHKQSGDQQKAEQQQGKNDTLYDQKQDNAKNNSHGDDQHNQEQQSDSLDQQGKQQGTDSNQHPQHELGQEHGQHRDTKSQESLGDKNPSVDGSDQTAGDNQGATQHDGKQEELSDTTKEKKEKSGIYEKPSLKNDLQQVYEGKASDDERLSQYHALVMKTLEDLEQKVQKHGIKDKVAMQGAGQHGKKGW